MPSEVEVALAKFQGGVEAGLQEVGREVRDLKEQVREVNAAIVGDGTRSNPGMNSRLTQLEELRERGDKKVTAALIAAISAFIGGILDLLWRNFHK